MENVEIQVNVGIALNPFGFGQVKTEAPVKFKGPEEVEKGLLMAEGILDQTDADPGSGKIEFDLLDLLRKANVKLPKNAAAVIGVARPMITLDVIP
jgi:hypothetical protein